MKKYKMWTKKDIKTVIHLWEDKTKDEIAKELGRKPHNVNWVAGEIRKAGYPLAKKSTTGIVLGLIKEVIAELPKPKIR